MNELVIKTESAKIGCEARDVIGKAIAALTAMKPGWRSAFRSDDEILAYKQQMAKALIESGVTEKSMLQAGLAKARQDQSAFLPSTGKFVAWCQESESKPQTYHIALQHDQSEDEQKQAQKRIEELKGLLK
jgi:hypothetical protein